MQMIIIQSWNKLQYFDGYWLVANSRNRTFLKRGVYAVVATMSYLTATEQN